MIAPVVLALLAAQHSQEWNCADPQVEMNACAALDFERADRELNILWRQVDAGARAADGEIDRRYDRRPAGLTKLREAQYAWIMLRGAHCAVRAYGEAPGGSMKPVICEGCRAGLTRERIHRLRGPAE